MQTHIYILIKLFLKVYPLNNKGDTSSTTPFPLIELISFPTCLYYNCAPELIIGKYADLLKNVESDTHQLSLAYICKIA